MDVMVSVLVFVIVCLAVLLSYLYVLNHRLDETERKEEADKAWKKEQGRQKRAAKVKIVSTNPLSNSAGAHDSKVKHQSESTL